jgi:chromosome segregation ATPase
MPAVATVQSARIHVQTPDGRKEWHDVSADDSLIIGSSQSCSVRLDSSDIASMHCLIKLENGRLSVQDWYTSLGTYLNGERIQQQCGFDPGDEIRIGEFVLTAEFFDSGASLDAGATSRGKAPSAPHSQPSTSSSQLFPDDELSSVADWARESGLDEANAAFREETQPDEEDGPPRAASSSELKQLKLRITELELENDELRLQAEAFQESAGEAVDPFDLEMVDLLKSEVQQLQHEVAQRDARIAELADVDRPAAEEDHSESDAMVERLDQLLNELQLSDERAKTLEDLLRAADEATRAETDERRQLAEWVGDIEAKIGEREAEWQAGQDALQKRIDDLHGDRERFNDRLKELGSKEGTSASAKLIEELREEVESLRNKLEETENARVALRKKIDDVEFQNTIEARDKFIEQKIREERLDMANEHAQIARERAEVARLKAQYEVKTSSSTDGATDDATCRVQAFREHLKEIHKEESQEKESKKLTSRLARLWKRLEGN